MGQVIAFFQEDDVRRDIISTWPCIYEQVTRRLFYHNSTVRERQAVVIEHFQFLQSRFIAEAIRKVYLNEGIILWADEFQDESLTLRLNFNSGFHHKEGLAAIELNLGQKRIYQVVFWIAPNSKGEMALWIGALQGSKGGQEAVRDLTKHLFGYRTKNFVLFALRSMARHLEIQRVYAVSNLGFYTNNHIRSDRMLKTSLDEFWLETGGTVSDDRRFFQLPLIEPQKTIDQVQSHKRNLYKKRFAALAAIDNQILQTLDSYRIAPNMLSTGK